MLAHLPSHHEGGCDHEAGGSEATPDWKETEKAPVPNGDDDPTSEVGAQATWSAKATDVTGKSVPGPPDSKTPTFVAGVSEYVFEKVGKVAPAPPQKRYADIIAPRGATPAAHVGPVAETLPNTNMTSLVAFDVTIQPAVASSGPVAAAKRMVANCLDGEMPTAIGAAYAGPVGLLLEPANALRTPTPSATAPPEPP